MMWFYKFALLALLDQTSIPAVKGQKASIPLWIPLPGELPDMNTPSPGAFTCPAATNSFLDFCIESELTFMTSGGSIPPDTHGAAGPNSLCSVVNVAFQCIRRDGTSIATFPVTSFDTFLSDLGTTSLFDPKVVYDVHANRFVIVVMDYTSSPNASIFVAVSKTNDPLTGTANDWYRFKINTFIDGNWADYPGFAVDEEAIYITANMFSASGDAYQKSLLWIVPKSPFYSGGTPTSAVYDFMALSGSNFGAFTPMPAMVRAPAGIPNNVGTYLISHQGNNGSNDFLTICFVKNPLAATPSFGCNQIAVPRVNFVGPNYAPQLGSSAVIDTSDGRALQAVWADNFLWTTFTVGQSNGESAVYWGKFNANGVDPPTLAAQGTIDGEDIQAATWTYMSSLDVNSKGVAAFGFTVSSTNMYASAYATIRDNTGVVHTPQAIRVGLGPYSVDFGRGDVRWGDYTGTSLDPVNEDCFWTFQEYAGDTTVSPSFGVGHWRNVWGRICFVPPTNAPTKAPTNAPTEAPTNAPTKAPTNAPTKAPTNAPSKAPTNSPSKAPTNAPTKAPTNGPTKAPTNAPTKAPTNAPVQPGSPTHAPTKAPTHAPTKAPTNAPTKAPTNAPTKAPTNAPVQPDSPTNAPTKAPTNAPVQPGGPTNAPTKAPINAPTKAPTNAPVQAGGPTNAPSKAPTNAPVQPGSPTKAPTSVPNKAPTKTPTKAPGVSTSKPTYRFLRCKRDGSRCFRPIRCCSGKCEGRRCVP